MIFLKKPRRSRSRWLGASLLVLAMWGCGATPKLPASSSPAPAESRATGENVSAFLREAYGHIRERRYREAEQLLLKAAAINPGDPWVQLNLGVVYQRTGRLDLARKAYAQAMASADRTDQVAVEASDSSMVARSVADIAQQNYNSIARETQGAAPVQSAPIARKAPERPADATAATDSRPVAPGAVASVTTAMPALAPPPAAKPVAEPPVTKSVPASSAREAALTALGAWHAAWQANDVDGYLRAYVPEYRGKERLPEDWRANRRRIISQSGKIAIRLGDPTVEERGTDRLSLSMPFSYRSERFVDEGTKRLEMRRVGERWLITDEAFIPAR